MSNIIGIANIIGNGGSGTPTVSTAITPIDIKGGVIRNIDNATGDIARTTNGWIEDIKYGCYMSRAGSTSGEFDTAVKRTGGKTLKLSAIDTAGNITVSNFDFTLNNYSKNLIPIKANTAYKISCYVKTNNVPANGAFIDLVEKNVSGTTTATNVFNKLSGSVDWTECTGSFTSTATSVWAQIRLQKNVTGNISDAWFDINSMTLEEVSTITNSAATPVKFYPKVTPVTSTDNIDQSMVTDGRTNPFGTVAQKLKAEQFLPTKKYLTGVTLKNSAATGTFIGDVTISIQADNAGKPSGSAIVSKTYTSAEWINFGTAEFNVLFANSITLTVDGSTKYWIVKASSTGDDSNYSNERASTSDLYTSGLYALSADGVTWTNIANQDLYFKTLYSKNTTNFTVRTDTETLSVTAPTVEGWANGEVIDTTDGTYGITPLTLAAGDNTVYVSSNGSTLADSDTDESLQATLNGVMVG